MPLMPCMYCPENTNVPKHRVMLLSLCEVEETDVDGGAIAMYHHSKPKISLVAHSKKTALKHSESLSFEKLILCAEDPSQKLSSVVDKYVENYKCSRTSHPHWTKTFDELVFDRS